MYWFECLILVLMFPLNYVKCLWNKELSNWNNDSSCICIVFQFNSRFCQYFNMYFLFDLLVTELLCDLLSTISFIMRWSWCGWSLFGSPSHGNIWWLFWIPQNVYGIRSVIKLEVLKISFFLWFQYFPSLNLYSLNDL